MIETFAKRWYEKKNDLAAHFSINPPKNYLELVRATLKIIFGEGSSHGFPYWNRINSINCTHYDVTGPLILIIGSSYSSNDYWYIRLDYKTQYPISDVLQKISETVDLREQFYQHMTLALHIVQRLTKIEENPWDYYYDDDFREVGE